jgi:hypothetical protein
MTNATTFDIAGIAGLSPEELETVGRDAFANERVLAFLPSLLSTYFDVICLGINCALYGYWFQFARETERTANRVLVVRYSPC